MATDPVCGMSVVAYDAKGRSEYRGQMYYFCSEACRDAFSSNPTKFLARTDESIKDLQIQLYRLLSGRSCLVGLGAAFSVVGFYLGLNTLASDWYNAQLQFQEYGVWIMALAVGFGFQAMLFSSYRRWHGGESMKAATYSLATSGGLSTTAMAACCAHYLVVILPVLGLPFLSAAAASLAGYQTYFFLAGVVSNLFGIGLMFRMIYRGAMIRMKGFKLLWTRRAHEAG